MKSKALALVAALCLCSAVADPVPVVLQSVTHSLQQVISGCGTC